MKRVFAALAIFFSPAVVWAVEVGVNDFIYSADLMRDGATPFPVTGAANAIYGLQKGTDLYLCFVADDAERQQVRQTILLAELNGEGNTRRLPNIPVICVMTQ